MVKTSLVEEYKVAGREFIEKLDRHGIDVRGAFWLYREDPDDWRLMLAIPRVDEAGSSEVYGSIYPVMREHNKLGLSDVTVLGLNDPLIRSMSSRSRTGTELENLLVRREFLNGTYIEEAYIYRMNL